MEPLLAAVWTEVFSIVALASCLLVVVPIELRSQCTRADYLLNRCLREETHLQTFVVMAVMIMHVLTVVIVVATPGTLIVILTLAQVGAS